MVKRPVVAAKVGQAVSDAQYGVIYPAPGDTNPNGKIIDNPFLPGAETLTKVVKETIFGPAHFWIDNK